MKRWRRGWWLLALLAIVVLGWRYVGRDDRQALSPVQREADAAALHDPALIARGEYLATVGDCAACHTARDGQRYAGGRSLGTPFGDVPAPNITPDPETGIGQWSFDDFWNALHRGKGRQGELLYPVFSYTSFTRVSRDDALAIFAYLKSLPPVQRPDTALGLAFPYNVRSSLVAWRALYFKPGEYRPNVTRTKYFGGSQTAYEETWPANVLASRDYPEPMVGIFVAGEQDAHFRPQVEDTATAAEDAGWKVTYWAVPDAGHSSPTLTKGLATGYNQLIGSWLKTGATGAGLASSATACAFFTFDSSCAI